MNSDLPIRQAPHRTNAAAMGDSSSQQSYESFLHQVYTSTSTNTTQKLYDEWASKYDSDLSNEGYASPSITVDSIIKNLDRSSQTSQRLDGKLGVLDAGCGTGQVGVLLQAAAKQGLQGLDVQIDGADLSPGMLDVARKSGAYRDLKEVDLSKRLDIPTETYDVVACVGTLTKGHVGPGVLKEFVRIAKRGWGIIAVTVIDEIWESGGYKAVVAEEEKYGRVEILRDELFNVWKEDKKGGRLIVLRRKYLAQEIAHAGIGA